MEMETEWKGKGRGREGPGKVRKRNRIDDFNRSISSSISPGERTSSTHAQSVE